MTDRLFLVFESIPYVLIVALVAKAEFVSFLGAAAIPSLKVPIPDWAFLAIALHRLLLPMIMAASVVQGSVIRIETNSAACQRPGDRIKVLQAPGQQD